MTPPLLYRVDAWLIALYLFLGMAVLWHVFYRLATRRPRPPDSETHDLGGVDAAVAGLLALILAFSFTMASNRFDMREDVIVREANALETTYLRCDYIEASAQAGCRAALVRYAELRVQFFEIGFDPERLEDVIQQSQRIQRGLWQHVGRAVYGRENPVNALLVASLNELIDLNTERIAGNRRVVPEEVIVVTMLLCFALATFGGYGYGLVRNRQFLPWVGFSALVTLVFWVTLDFDRPGRGWIRPTRGNSIMRDLARDLAKRSVEPQR